MKRLVLGMIAHVDSGKTTLSEGLLYASGEISKLGRVDHGDAFLDTNTIEKERGITIFSKQAVMSMGDCEFTLLDTPGHVDFSAETERTMRVLDYAVLVISAQDGVQSHTETLWRLLHHYDVPTFIFVNKMDLPAADKYTVMAELQKKLSDACVDFTEMSAEFYETAAMSEETLLDEYMQTEKLSDDSLRNAICARKLFPCFFGSALRNEGVREFAENLVKYTKDLNIKKEFGAKIFKIADDEKGQRLTYMKITGGSLKVKTVLNGEKWSAKINELRIYSGIKFKSVQEVFAGGVCAATGLGDTHPGEGIGAEQNDAELILEPVFTYSVKLPEGSDTLKTLAIFRKLEEEETQMHVLWNEHLQKIDVQIMGEVQLEVLKRVLFERFDVKAEFEHGSIIYKETIENRVEGVGHYEPLRHYAEVHLLLEPAKRGAGLIFAANCSEDILDKNWQRLIMTHLREKIHKGVLTGAAITDMKITLINGRAHQKHTEGGDFRQATYRAVRQGLMQAQSIVLEPYYAFSLEVPTDSVGRAMSDLQCMGAEFSTPTVFEESSVIKGKAAVSKIRDYHADVIAYTHGLGRLSCQFCGYEPCVNQGEVIEKAGYNCEADTDNTANSVFCAHGSGFAVKWDEVFDYMHLSGLNTGKGLNEIYTPHETRKIEGTEEELLKIFESTYGTIKRELPRPMKTIKSVPKSVYKGKPMKTGSEYMLVDGYNIIHAWEELAKIAKESLEDARARLIDILANYRAVKQNNVILVFDAYKVRGGTRELEKIHDISIVYTKEAETADNYIEKVSKELSKNYRVRVATSDSLEQIIIFGNGAERVPAHDLLAEVKEAECEMRRILEANRAFN